MRIVHLINFVDPAYGGPAAALEAMTAEQAAAGHDVTIVSTDRAYTRSGTFRATSYSVPASASGTSIRSRPSASARAVSWMTRISATSEFREMLP